MQIVGRIRKTSTKLIPMLKILPFIILVFFVPPLFAYFHYVMIKKIYKKPNKATGLLYLGVIIRLFILIGGLYYLWTVRFTGWGLILCLVLIFISLIVSILILYKLRSSRKDSEKQLIQK